MWVGVKQILQSPKALRSRLACRKYRTHCGQSNNATDLPTLCSLTLGSCTGPAATPKHLEWELLCCPPRSALLVPKAPLLPPLMGMGSSGSDCVFMCIMCSGTGGCAGAAWPSLQINVQAAPGWAKTSEFSSPDGYLSLRAVKKPFLPRLVVWEGKVSARKKNHGEILTTPLLANGHLGFLDSNG